MKIFISILFSVFFMRTALSFELPDINIPDINITANDGVCLGVDMKYCGPGKYLPVGSNTCASCHERCGPMNRLPDDGTECTLCISNGSWVPCGYDKPGTRAFYCEGGCLYRNTSINRGLSECPKGFPNLDDPEDGKKCYTEFRFYPGKDATFLTLEATSDDDYVEGIMYSKASSDMFEYVYDVSSNVPTVGHYLKEKFINGLEKPYKPDYLFNNWVIGEGTNQTKVKDNTNIQSVTDVPASRTSNKRLYAVWGYRVRYFSDSGSVLNSATLGEAYTLKGQTDFGNNNYLFKKNGAVFVGWCPESPNCSEASLLHPGDKICDADNCGSNVKKITHPDGVYKLYAQYHECSSAAGDNFVVDDNNNCVCKKGYYKDGETCKECDSGQTTQNIGATSEDECGYFFRYKVGNTYKSWTWPEDSVTQDSVSLP